MFGSKSYFGTEAIIVNVVATAICEEATLRIYQATLIGFLSLIVLGVPSVYAQAKAASDGQKKSAPAAQKGQSAALAEQIERGKYIIAITGCNHCHTAGFEAAGGEIPESQRLLGDSTGNWGTWGTTYASNLRLSL